MSSSAGAGLGYHRTFAPGILLSGGVVIALEQYVSVIIGGLMLWLAIAAWRLRKKRAIPGPAAMATMNELLSKDRRAAIQIILEERTGERDPEDRDGNLPDLEQPTSRGPFDP